MVIDAERQVAWGSHGWDGNERNVGYADTGVEYQRIRGPRDWTRWDKESMQLEACWRHKAFTAEREAGDVWVTGVDWTSVLCESRSSCTVAASATTVEAEE